MAKEDAVADLSKGTLPVALVVGLVASVVAGVSGYATSQATASQAVKDQVVAVDAATKATAAEVKEQGKALVDHDKRLQRVEDAQVSMVELLREIRSDQKEMKGAVQELQARKPR